MLIRQAYLQPILIYIRQIQDKLERIRSEEIWECTGRKMKEISKGTMNLRIKLSGDSWISSTAQMKRFTLLTYQVE